MRIVSYRQSGTPSYGFLVGDDGIVDRSAVPGLTAASVRELIAGGALPDASVVESLAPTTTPSIFTRKGRSGSRAWAASSASPTRSARCPAG